MQTYQKLALELFGKFITGTLHAIIRGIADDDDEMMAPVRKIKISM
jgi:hypothetical protein